MHPRLSMGTKPSTHDASPPLLGWPPSQSARKAHTQRLLCGLHEFARSPQPLVDLLSIASRDTHSLILHTSLASPARSLAAPSLLAQFPLIHLTLQQLLKEAKKNELFVWKKPR